MTKPVIAVEGVSKRYLVGHQIVKPERSTLRDVIGRETHGFMRKAVDVFRGRQIIQGDAVEEFWALKDVNLEVKQGEVVGIIGRNGAGKSTLLKILSRITEPTEGRVTLRGRVACLLEVGTGFHQELTGRENIFLNGAILGMRKPEIRRKFDEIVAFAEVERFLDTPVKHYSSGMYVRLAFAVAAHLEPEILIVDEVLAVGDIQFQKKCLGKMEGVVKEGRTVLFVSHQMAAINQLCRNIIWLDNGRLLEYAAANIVMQKYLTRDVSGAPIVEVKRPHNNIGLFFRKISILSHEQNPSTELDVRFPFIVRLCYQVTKMLTGVEMAIRVKTIDGVSVFTAVYSDNSDIKKMDKIPGYYVASVQIPALFLMPGNYALSAHAFQFKAGFHPLQIVDNIIRFNICETGTKIGKYNDHKNIGVVLVDFPWKDEVSIESGM